MKSSILFLSIILCIFFAGCAANEKASDESQSGAKDLGVVVVYVSTDQDYSEPILKDFEARTGIKVKAVYDTETTKTVGMVNRLIAEKDNPQADVFWNNEVSRTLILKNGGILTPYVSPNSIDKPANLKDPDGYWTGFSARARMLIYNTKLVSEENAPKSVLDIIKPVFKDKVCLGNPILGATANHMAALYALWGKEKAEKYITDLKNNGVKIVESNGMVKDQVVAGDCYVGITDSDDANDAIVNHQPAKILYPDQDSFGTYIMPNTVMMIKGGPNPENGRKLVDYLLGKDAEAKLAASKAVQIPLGKGVPKPSNVPDISEIKQMNLTIYQVSAEFNESQAFVQKTLLT